MDMGENELVLQPLGEGVYGAQSGLASMAGDWQAEALVRRAGLDDVRTQFVVPLDQPAAPGPASGQPVPVYSGTPTAPSAARTIRNPVPATEESLATGKQLYTQYCLVCHGVQGKGDGPAARAMRPPPADLSIHVSQHTDGELWWWITNGIAGTPMPAWKDALTDEERWHVLNYIKEAFTPRTS
jgi:mono/diheme cytochrome c family protein